MTAAAMEGDREACLAAGMDDYITKPVRLEAVAAAVERWIAAPGAVAVTADDTTLPSDEAAPDALDPSQIEVLRSLDDGDGAVLGEIIEEYLAQTDEARGELVRGRRGRRRVAVERAAHKLRGASANVGATVLARSAPRWRLMAAWPNSTALRAAATGSTPSSLASEMPSAWSDVTTLG